jgi:hypothetical protein
MVDSSAVQNRLASWWFDYDRGAFDAFPDYFASDARFVCRSDTGDNEFEQYFRADESGHDAVVKWQIEHRKQGPYPLRHNGTNVHVTAVDGDEAAFRSYIFVTQIVDGLVANLSSGVCVGRVRDEGGTLRFTEMQVILDYLNSAQFDAAVAAKQLG